MYNKTNARQPRKKNSWKKRGSHNKSHSRKRKFSGNTININRFINKAEMTTCFKANRGDNCCTNVTHNQNGICIKN